jgi:uncharacterized protein (TIGR00251 family)
MTSLKDAIKHSPHGVIVALHVVPGSSEVLFPAAYNPWRKSIEIKVRSLAQENKANTEVVETIARFFGLKVDDVLLASGEKRREKTVVLRRISADTVCTKLQEALHG